MNQIQIEWQIPGVTPNLRLTVSPQMTSSFLAGIPMAESLGDPAKVAAWTLNWTPILEENGVFQILAHARLRKSEPANIKQTVTADQAAKGIAVGEAKLKFSAKTSPAEVPPLSIVWVLIVSRTRVTNQQKSDVPASILGQAHSVLGFKPVVLAAREITLGLRRAEITALGDDEAMHVELRSLGGIPDPIAISRGTPTEPIFMFSVNLEGRAQTRTTENLIRLASNGWVGAPVFAGPFQIFKNETYVVIAGRADSVAAKKIVAANRTWTAVGGQTTRARFVDMQNDRVILRKEDGAFVTVPLSQLSALDVALIADSRNDPPTQVLSPQVVNDVANGSLAPHLLPPLKDPPPNP